MELQPLRVTKIAHTRVDLEALQTFGLMHQLDAKEPETLIEFAGRTCAGSYSRPNPATARTSDYVQSLVDKGHLSVSEHASATFLIEGVSRSFLAQITRHRHLSFSVQSQRLDATTGINTVVHPTLHKHNLDSLLSEHMTASTTLYKAVVQQLKFSGYSQRQAQEAAREFLPNAASVKMIVSGNLRSWKEFVEKRAVSGADKQIQQVAVEINNCLHEESPTLFPLIEAVA
jgi:thymidylate synthase (FAD)